MTDSTDIDLPRGGRKRRRLGFLWWLGITLALIIGLPAAAITAWSIGASRRAEAELDLIRAAGEPVTPADLEAFYAPPPPEEDVTELWLEAMRLVDVPEFRSMGEGLPFVGLGKEPAWGHSWSQKQQAEDFLGQFAAARESAYMAARNGGRARFPIDFSKGMTAYLDESQQQRQLIRLLQLQGFTSAYVEDSRGAAASSMALLQFGSAIGSEPMVVSVLVAIATDSIACHQIEAHLSHLTFTDVDLSQLQQCPRAKQYVLDLQRGLVGDRPLIAQAINTAKNQWKFDAESPPRTFLTRGNDLHCYLRFTRLMIASAHLPWPQGKMRREQLAAEFEVQTYGGVVARWTHPMSLMLDPTMAPPFDAATRATAIAAITDAGLAAELYRRRHGDFPERLDQLVPEFLPAVPEDPFDGQPLRYVRRDDACVIYSIGLDQTDDGGVEEKQSTKPDITFTVRKPRVM